MGFLAHQAFHWASFHKGTPGYSPVAQKTYHRYWDPLQGHFRPGLHRLSEHELLQLQAAVRQEQKALVFVKTITDQVLIPGQQAASLAKGTTSA